MRCIAVLNQKGGVGKTTSTVNVASALARKGFKTLVIDLDPQAHATLHLGLLPGRSGPSMYEALTENLPLSNFRKNVAPNLDVCGSHIDLAAAEVELISTVGREMILRDLLAVEKDSYDFVLMDCPPSLSVLTLNALCAAGEVMIPMQAHFLALHGLSKLLETIHLVSKRVNKNLKVSGVLLCMYESGTRLGSEVVEDLDAFFDKRRQNAAPWNDAQVFKTKIRRNIRLAEAPSFGQSIFDYSPTSRGAEDYAALASELIGAEVPKTMDEPTADDPPLVPNPTTTNHQTSDHAAKVTIAPEADSSHSLPVSDSAPASDQFPVVSRPVPMPVVYQRNESGHGFPKPHSINPANHLVKGKTEWTS